LLESLAPLIQSQVGKFAGVGLPRASIEMEAKRLTILALDSYDPAKAQMNTHIINYLKKLQRHVITYQNVARIPEPRAIGIGKYQTIYDNLESEKGREPTITELADAMVWPTSEIERFQSEQRKDLSMTPADDSTTGFYYFQSPLNPELPSSDQMQAMQFVYYDSDPIDKKILEYSLPQLGFKKTPMTKKWIANKLKLTPHEIRRRQRLKGTQIKELID
tara:strand:- start:619 stop:1275 length:657 start_codon:yes stop_codon:yes gene_type:complete